MTTETKEETSAEAAARLHKELLPTLPTDVADLVWSKAWEDGHASGMYEVEVHYSDLAEMVSKAYEAGHRDGFNEGWDDGYSEGDSDGWENGYTLGLERGQEESA